MEDNKERNKRVAEIYTSAVEVFNTINELEKLNSDYFASNWTVGLSNVVYDIKHMSNTMLSQQFSLDYRQANTFMSYLKIFEFLLNKMADELVIYDEGITTVQFIQRNLEVTFQPFGAYICSRIRDLGMLNEIPKILQTMYHQYSENMDELKGIDMSNIFDIAFSDEDALMNDDEYLEEVRGEMTRMFGEDANIEDFTRISGILGNYLESAEQEASIELDF